MGYADSSDGKDDGKVPIGLMGMTEWGRDEDAIAWGYDAERWVHEGLKGGRQRPPSPNRVNVLGGKAQENENEPSSES